MKRWLRLIASMLVVTVLVFSLASCAGKFTLTHKLLNWNLSLNKWLGSFLLFIFIVLPVYGVCMLVDWLILNVIEFYSHSNPVGTSAAPQTKTESIDGRQVSLTLYPGKGINLDLTTEEADGSVRVMMVRTTEDGVTAKMLEQGKESIITTRPGPDDTVERCVEDRCKTINQDEQAAMLDQIDGLDALLTQVDRLASDGSLGQEVGFVKFMPGLCAESLH